MSGLPADAHVHSEWSWDYASDPSSRGAMTRIRERAVRIGLPAVVFAEHLDLEPAWRVDDGDIGEHAQRYVDAAGYVRLPPSMSRDILRRSIAVAGSRRSRQRLQQSEDG